MQRRNSSRRSSFALSSSRVIVRTMPLGPSAPRYKGFTRRREAPPPAHRDLGDLGPPEVHGIHDRAPRDGPGVGVDKDAGTRVEDGASPTGVLGVKRDRGARIVPLNAGMPGPAAFLEDRQEPGELVVRDAGPVLVPLLALHV